MTRFNHTVYTLSAGQRTRLKCIQSSKMSHASCLKAVCLWVSSPLQWRWWRWAHHCRRAGGVMTACYCIRPSPTTRRSPERTATDSSASASSPSPRHRGARLFRFIILSHDRGGVWCLWTVQAWSHSSFVCKHRWHTISWPEVSSDSWTNRSFESDLFNEVAKSVRKTELKNSLIDQTVWEFLVLNESRVIRNDQRNNVSADSRWFRVIIENLVWFNAGVGNVDPGDCGQASRALKCTVKRAALFFNVRV